MKKFLVVALLAALMFPPNSSVGEAAVIPLDLKALANGSTLIVRGHIASSTPHWQDDSRGRLIVTDFNVDVREVLYGRVPAGGRGLVLEAEGGRVGKIICRSWEEAVVSQGEDVVLFLVAHPQRENTWRTYGWFQGKLTLLDGRVREAKDRLWAETRDELAGYIAERDK